jgi:hypothetical protein
MKSSNASKYKASAATRNKINKLIEITNGLYAGEQYSITRLTVLKSLCADPGVARRFALYLAKLAQSALENQLGAAIPGTVPAKHRPVVQKAVALMEQAVAEEFEAAALEPLRKVLYELMGLQNTFEKQSWGPVRLIHSKFTLVVEKAAECILSPHACGQLAYHAARDYAERYNPRYGTGLIPESAPLMADICNFWIDFYGLMLDNDQHPWNRKVQSW